MYLALAGLVMFLAGCGQDGAVSVDMQVQGDPVAVPDTGDFDEEGYEDTNNSNY